MSASLSDAVRHLDRDQFRAALSHWGSEKGIDLSFQSLRPAHMEFLVSCLAGTMSIPNSCVFPRINLYLNQLGVDGASFLRSLAVADLDVGSNAFGNAGVQSLFAELDCPLFQHLRTLSLHENGIAAAGATHIREGLKRLNDSGSTHLEAILLGGNRLGDTGVQKLVEGADALAGVRHLDLNRNQIGDTGLVALAAFLGTDPDLEELSLDMNSFSEVGVAALATGLSTNSHLQVLQLSFNSLSTKGNAIELICSGVCKSGIMFLGISGNGIDARDAVHLSELLQTSRRLAVLDLAKNDLKAAGALELAQGLSRNSTLKVLKLDANGVGDVGAQAIASALRSCRLARLHLATNSITDAVMGDISSVLWSTSSLEQLYLSGNAVSADGLVELIGCLRSRLLAAGETHDHFSLPSFSQFELLDLRRNLLDEDERSEVVRLVAECLRSVSHQSESGNVNSELTVRVEPHTNVTFSNCLKLLCHDETSRPSEDDAT